MRDRNAPQKQVWRAEIVLLSADGVGTTRSNAGPASPRPASGVGKNASRGRASRACCATRHALRALRRSERKLRHAWWL